MSANEVYMDPAEVRKIARGLELVSTVLKGVSTALEIQMMILKTTAFVGLVGGLAVERFLASYKPKIDRLAQKTAELADDVEKSVQKWEAATQR